MKVKDTYISTWKEQPSYYAGDELHQIKQERIQQALSSSEFDALVLFKSEAVRYATDFYVKGYRTLMELEYFVVILPGQKPVVAFSSGSDQYRIQVRSDIADWRKLPARDEWYKVLAQVLEDYGVSNGCIGVDLMPMDIYLELKKLQPQLEFKSAKEIWVDLTVIKHPAEIELIKEALALVEIGMYAARDAIGPGVREYEVAAAAVHAMRMNGSEMEPFLPLVASGINTCIFERIATEKRIRPGELVIVDLGSVYRGYTGDSGRTFSCGKPTAMQQKIYEATYQALQAAIQAVRPGVTCEAIDNAAREVIISHGFGEYQHQFATGHQLGYGLHGAPLIDRGVDFVLQPGMIFALEPRITLFDQPSVGGVHLEEVILVTESGYEVLSRIEFEEGMLT